VVERSSVNTKERREMKSLLPLAAGGAGVAMWSPLPKWIKLLVGGGLIALASIELVKDGNEAWFSGSIFGGQAAQGDAQAANPRKVEADLAAGRPTTNAAATATAQFEGLAADAKQKGVYADAAVESEAELRGKKAKGIRLTSTEELRLKELRIQEAQAIIQESIAVSAKQYSAGLAEIRAPDSLASQGERMLGALAGSKPSRAR
jgi:hypothetical protein